MTIEDRLEQIANHDWRVSMLAHTSDTAEEARLTIVRLRTWVRDLQSGMYVNCVYCGHRYGPGETTPVSMADALKEHISKCPEHPMSAMKASLKEMLCLISNSEHVETIGDGWREPYERAYNLVHS